MAATAQPTEIPTRDRVPVEETWDLSDLYKDDAAWEADAAKAERQIETASSHRGMLGESAMALRTAMDDVLKVRLTLEHVQVYAALRRDEDQTDTVAQARYERAMRLAIRAGEALAFFEPELLSIPEEKISEFLKHPMLAMYRHMLEDLLRHRPHVRSIEVEELLAQSGDVARAPSEAFAALDNADLTFGIVRDADGREVQLTKGRYQVLLESTNRDVRKAAHETFSQSYLDHRHTLASLYTASVHKDVYYARARRYESSRTAALFDINVPETVYDSLIQAVREARPTMERSINLRKQALGVDQVTLYDMRAPLAPAKPRSYTYREATEIVLNGLRALGEDYVDTLAEGYAGRWVDVPETRGKRSGAYSWGAYGAHPVILLNWNGSLSDVFTLAHESGHAMHSYLADHAQPFHDAGYPIFLAEIASTVNEVLLTWHLLAETPADDYLGRFELLNRFADDFHGTLVTQTMYADFEKQAHDLAEAGEPLTLETLCDIWASLQETYLPGIEVDEAARIRWARIPHFYRAFYVYQYATGLSAAVTLATKIRDEGEPARERYLQLLAAGGADYPLTLLQQAGVDMTSPEPVANALREYDRVLREMEQLIADGHVTPVR